MEARVTLGHGNGGKLSHELINEIILPALDKKHDSKQPAGADGAVLSLAANDIVFCTDSHVVKPHFFAGGNIGSLAVTGTVNDLAVMGARPLYLSCALIIEEGFEIAKLQQIMRSMGEMAEKCSVRVVTGDTKVVEKGAADGIYINTAGIGILQKKTPAGAGSIADGDVVLLSGSLADHGVVIFSAREGIQLQSGLASDMASIFPLAEMALATGTVRVMRDPTRGGLGTVLNEFVEQQGFGIELFEEKIPVKNEVQGVCELLGFDPLYLACEGRLVLVCPQPDAGKILRQWQQHPLGKDAAIIGQVKSSLAGQVILKTAIGGERIVGMLTGEILPRIC